MYCKRISFACVAAMGVALVLASAAAAQLPPIPGLRLLLQADSGVVLEPDPIDPNSVKVLSWQDQSGNGNNFTAVEDHEPRFDVTGGPVGQPVVTFLADDTEPGDGNEEYLLAEEFVDFSDWTIFAVVQGRTENDQHGADIFADYGADWGQGRMGIGLSAGSGNPDITTGWNVHARSDASGTSENINASGGNNENVQPEIITGKLDSTAKTVSVYSRNGGLLGSETNANYQGSNTQGAAGAPTIGTNSGFLNGGLSGYIAELILYDSALNDTDREAVEDYLNDKHFVGVGQPAITDFTWTQDRLGDWASNSNWLPGSGPPDGPNDKAIFQDRASITGPTNVSTAVPVTVNRIEFSNTNHNFIIGGFGSVNMSATTTPISEDPSISVQGTHKFQAVVNLLNDTAVDVASESTLTFSNTLDLMSHTLTKTGAGTMAILNNLVLGDGAVQIQQGTVSGNGTIGGDVVNDGGTISPGNSLDGSLSGVPEPTSLLLLAIGGLGCALGIRSLCTRQRVV